MEKIDLGVCAGRFWPGEGDGVAVVLPGAGYQPGFPLLWFARETLQRHGWAVVEVWDEWRGDDDPTAWVEARAAAALAYPDQAEQQLLVAKSISTHAAALAADRRLPAVWLTPLLTEEHVVTGLRRGAAPALLVGGSADAAWRSDVAASVGAEVLELEGANHSLEIPGDPLASIDALRRTTERIDGFLARLNR